MGKTYDCITDELALWFETQPVFFVATATSDPKTRVNLSPRGLDTFRVLDNRRVAWLDLTGSGVETIAHLRADGRITLMFCAFNGPPRIVRLHGHGRVHEPGDGAYDMLRRRFPDLPGERAIIDVEISRVASSCGFGVPRMEFLGPREQLVTFAERKDSGELAEYRARKNARSIDGLPGLESPNTTQTGRMMERRNANKVVGE